MSDGPRAPGTGSSTADIERELARAGALIAPVLEELLPCGRDDLLSEAIWYHLDTGGKRIRPAICVLTCERLGGDPAHALHFAAAVEVLHNMLLVHDDLEDGDTIRRDREAVWVRYGMPNAVNAGDYLLGVAFRAVVNSPVSDRVRVRLMTAFTDALESTCRGQALDLNCRGKADLTVHDYLEMVKLKTGRYLALGMVGGAIIAGLRRKPLAAIDTLGEDMGAAFQIRDDLIDLTAGKGRGGVTGNDIREGKASILYAHAISVASRAEKDALIRVMRKPRDKTTDADVERVKRLYQRLGSLEFAQDVAERLVSQAFETIERLPAANRDFFRQLTRYMASRTT
jgi:geranylgeranyl pyrophosphate synthase